MKTAEELAEERSTSASSSPAVEDEESPSSSASSSDEEDGSGPDEGSLGSMGSLEEFLPIKRGLSRWFSGQSKSFMSLAEAAALGSAQAVAKPESPFNKRRRILLSCKATWRRRASYLALREDETDDDPPVRPVGHRSLSLVDLQHAELA